MKIRGRERESFTVRFTRRIRELTGADNVALGDDVRRRVFALAFVSIVVPVVFGFAFSDLFTGQYFDAGVEGAFAVMLIVGARLLVRLRNPTPIYHGLMVMLLVLMSYLLRDPVEGSSRFFWLYNVVPVATFTLGRWEGGAYGTAMVVIVVLIRVFVPEMRETMPTDDFIRFVITYEILNTMVFLVEYARERTHLQLVSEHSGLVKAHQEIVRLSVTDALTGSYNRQFLNDRLPAEIERARRYEHPLSIVITDVDNFKHFNDVHGHRAGDAILRRVAEVLRGSLRRDIDWVARYGGEEFLIVLPETTLDPAYGVAERLRAAVSGIRLDWDGTELSCTASFGLAEFGPGLDRSGSLIEAADQALLRAKRSGRNCVIRHEGPRPADNDLPQAT